jgi:[acyl-carrier-protein] S-malonyltransferase
MQDDSMKAESGMMTLIGATRDAAEELCRRAASAGIIVPANYLGPRQIAVSGALSALDVAESLLKEMGIKRGVRLKVAGAFHSPFMHDGGEKLKMELERAVFRPPAIPFASNVSGAFVEDPDEIREHLGRQVTSPVFWNDTMERFIAKGITRFYEPGPGKVLSGILKKMDGSLKTFTLDEPSEIDDFVKEW